jgi:hypothetical protein
MLRPTGRCSSALQAEVRCLDSKCRIVGDDTGRGVHSLAERRADDAVVGKRRIETVLDQQVLLHTVDLDLDRARPTGRRRPESHRQVIRRRSPA